VLHHDDRQGTFFFFATTQLRIEIKSFDLTFFARHVCIKERRHQTSIVRNCGINMKLSIKWTNRPSCCLSLSPHHLFPSRNIHEKIGLGERKVCEYAWDINPISSTHSNSRKMESQRSRKKRKKKVKKKMSLLDPAEQTSPPIDSTPPLPPHGPHGPQAWVGGVHQHRLLPSRNSWMLLPSSLSLSLSLSLSRIRYRDRLHLDK
jgi:hypothetical protein